MRRLGLLVILLVLLAPPARADSCSGTAPIDGMCSASMLPQCTDISCTATATFATGRAFTGQVEIDIDGSLSGQHYSKQCTFVLGFGGACSLQASLTSFDLAACSTNVLGAGRWTLSCTTP